MTACFVRFKMGRKRNMSRAESRIMGERINATKAENEDQRQMAGQHRLSCPIELAKTYLRQRGFHVFAESVLSWDFRNSQLIVVGRTPMAANDVIAMADRIRARAG